MLFDTTFLIDLEREVKRGRPGAAYAFLQNNPSAPLFISIVSVGEFAEGFGLKEQHECMQCLQGYHVLGINEEIAWRAAQIARVLRRARATIGDNDLWIAATALERGLGLVTKNARHFDRVDGLKVITY